MEKGNKSSRKRIKYISIFILIVSGMYFIAYFPPILSSVLGEFTFFITLIALVVLPATSFGLPTGMSGEYIKNEEFILPLLFVASTLSIIAFWSGREMIKLRLRGLFMYSFVVASLALGILLDSIFNISKGTGLNNVKFFSGFPTPMLLAIIFLGTVISLWVDFAKLGILHKKSH